jgi:hypothetical protein
LLGFVGVVAHGPAQGLNPRLHDVGRPLNTIEFCAVAQHGYNISGVFFFVAYEFESNTPKHGDANDNKTWGIVDGIHPNVVLLLGIVVDGVV